MKITKERAKELLKNDRFPRSAKYDPEWVLKGWMGPNVLWLTEWLTEKMNLKPGIRVLDMGCGKALSSVFLAREYGVRVWANDLWVNATENWQRIQEVGMQDQICPIYAEAHALPYAEGFFDTIVSLDSYQYYGTDELYLPYFIKFLKPGGEIGIVVPGLVKDFDGPVPEHLMQPHHDRATFWVDECWSFHTAAWWQDHWEKFSCIESVIADLQPDGWKHWIQYEKACDEAGTLIFPSEAGLLESDAGRYLGMIRVTGVRK
jgi:ubiquinone/menaquinone biosynthesis C-methylase UbiE